MESIALSRSYSRRLYRAIIEFRMISEGDRILVGFSGGKDSAFLLYALVAIQRYSHINFEIAAGTVDLGFPLSDSIRDDMKAFVSELKVPYFTIKTNIGDIAFGKDQKKNPCAICAHLRRGSLNSLAIKNGFNKVALAHHQDDAVETFLMGILYSGQVHVFRPVTYLDRTRVTVIRPLVYFKQAEIKSAINRIGYNPPPNPCPGQDKTGRSAIRELIYNLSKENPMVYSNLFKALHSNAVGNLWPPMASRREMKNLHKAFFHEEENNLHNT